METFLLNVASTLYAAFVIMIPTTAVKSPDVFRIIAIPIRRAAFYCGIIVGTALIAGGYTSLQIVRAIVDTAPEAAKAVFESMNPLIERSEFAFGACIFVWVVTALTELVRGQLDKNQRVLVGERGDADKI